MQTILAQAEQGKSLPAAVGQISPRELALWFLRWAEDEKLRCEVRSDDKTLVVQVRPSWFWREPLRKRPVRSFTAGYLANQDEWFVHADGEDRDYFLFDHAGEAMTYLQNVVAEIRNS